MKICDCYYEQLHNRPVYGKYAGNIVRYEEQIIGRCKGTKDCEQCSCKGNKSECDFYPEVKEKANNNELKLMREYLAGKGTLEGFSFWCARKNK